MNETKVIYITGALGFIGSYVTRECLKRGWYVTGVDKITYAARPELLDEFSQYKNFRFIKSDINDLDTIYDCDYVINLAAETHVDNSIIESKKFLSSNISGVHKLLQLIKSNNIFTKPIFFHISTDEVYGDIINGAHTEKDLLNPSNPYSATKGAAELLITSWYRTFNVPYIIVRPTNNFGIGQYQEKLIPRICKSLFLGKKIPLHNNGTPRRIWLHARDTARAILHLIDKGIKNDIYNISGTQELTNLEVVTKIVKLIKNEDNPLPYCDFSYTRPGQDVRYNLDDSKLRKLGWDNVYNIDQELPSIVEYYKNNFIW